MCALPILSVSELTKTYPTTSGPLTVLHTVSFDLEAGTSLAIVGPSGSGKTTLLGLCAGLDYPSSGSVCLAGSKLEQLDEDGRARVRNLNVGFVFQNFQLIPTLSARENILIPLELREESNEVRAGYEVLADELLERVGLSARANHYPIQLSGGEQQRVALARAFINNPKILFCDEPTGNLDSENATAMIDLIFGLNLEKQTTLVLVTHDSDLAKRCKRILRFRSGKIISDSNHLA
ncbi:MAG: ABC transporter ATP-binding protein [Verrucomicrobiota bacterium]|jgi:putative ABC transport system ATP-binding protein